jgi:superfamily II DNA or RNA helicase
MSQTTYSPGALVRARGREWVVLAGSEGPLLRLRPLTGSEADQTILHMALEPEPITDATFPWPQASQMASQAGSSLLRDATILSLRRGAGPFRSFGQVSVAPRAYQLVPLMMALQLPTVRLLIADDVGIGKTIEAGLILREFHDRGELERFTVLCPPHLVDQWVNELSDRFHLRATPVTATSAARLERDLPPGDSIFKAYPYTVVSLDYIKQEQRRNEFLHACPAFVVVDEAHTCAGSAQGRHQRYNLLKALSNDGDRHMVLLTATPHSGDEVAFYRLLGLLDPAFEQLETLQGAARERLRDRLSRHFVQRRRPDIAEWKDGSLFPKRETTEITYSLAGPWKQFFDGVLDYCATVVEQAGLDQRARRLNFWGTLALMRCVASSPAAAVQALRTRHSGLSLPDTGAEDDDAFANRVFDGTLDALPDDDHEPALGGESEALEELIIQAERLITEGSDPKFAALQTHLKGLLAKGFSPVVFCRYIATAHALARDLAQVWRDVRVMAVTGELAPDERKLAVAELGEHAKRLLIATDCLSEGINLQDSFDAVIHYDLSWNPTRHEQREGRVDRFGQIRDTVRTTLLYGHDNPVDGAVLQVILRKANAIRQELGVPVPLPDEGHHLTEALLQAVFLRRQELDAARRGQMRFEFNDLTETKAIDTVWQDVAARAKANRTVFAQRRLKPEDVMPEWQRTTALLGDAGSVREFTERAMARLGTALQPLQRGYKAVLSSLPLAMREQLEAEGFSGTLRIDFGSPPAPQCQPILRSHPLVATLAEGLLSRALSPSDQAEGPATLGRAGCWTTNAVSRATVVTLLRLRHQLLTQSARGEATLLVEEATAIALSPQGELLLTGLDAMALLDAPPCSELAEQARLRKVNDALSLLARQQATLDDFARQRAQALLADHRRVREAASGRGQYSVKALLPVDVIGVFVLLPNGEA